MVGLVSLSCSYVTKSMCWSNKCFQGKQCRPYYQVEVTIGTKQIGTKRIPHYIKNAHLYQVFESTIRNPGAHHIISRCDDFSNKQDTLKKIILKSLTNLSAVLIEFLKSNFSQVLQFYDCNINLFVSVINLGYTQSYHFLLISKICAYFQGQCLRKRECAYF